MFETPEEVRKAMLDLNILETIKKVSKEEIQFQDYYEPQIFTSHEAQSDRFCKTLYYGNNLPITDRPSLAFTQLAVDQFTNVGLDALGERLGRLDMIRAADITRKACAGPNSLVLALLYLEKLRKRSPDYLTTISSADLFLVSLMVASKFLQDDGEVDEVFNDEWASSGGIDTKELNMLELNFLSALDWRIYVNNQEFEKAVKKLESDIAFKEVSKRGWASYTDLEVLSMNTEIQNLCRIAINYTLKMTAVCMTAYAAGLLSLVGTAAVLHTTPVGPEAVCSSIKTIAASLSSGEVNQNSIDQELESNPDIFDHTPANDLLSGLASEKNQSSADWLAGYSKQDDSSSTDPDGIYDHLWIQTDVTDNLGVEVDFGSQSLQDEKQCSISSNLARWRQSGLLGDTLSWIR